MRRWMLGVLLATLPLVASSEVTLSTSVERISTTVNLPDPQPPMDAVPGTTAPAAVQVEQVESAADVPSEVFSGDVLRYTIRFENTSSQDVSAGSVVITNPLPAETVYLEGSAMGQDTLITYSVDGETFASPEQLLVGEGAQARAAGAAEYRAIRWAYQPLLPAGAASEVSFELLIP